MNDKVKDLNEGAGSQEELMKSLAQIDEEGQLSDDVLDAVSGGTLGKIKFENGIGIIEPIYGMMHKPDVEPLPGTASL